MVLIQAGQFSMGNSSSSAPWNETPSRVVYVNAFYMDVTEVTNAQYKQFLDATGHPAPKYWNNNRLNKPDMPVVGVTWHDAVKYAEWAGKRLPTEAEWEYAARGGLDGVKFPWGNESAKDHAWYSKPLISASPTNVASYAPNGYGLYDMAGNVAEWCSDWYRSDAYKNAAISNNPTGPSDGSEKVVRGGSWYEDEYYLRCSARKGMAAGIYSSSVGFRCVASAP